MRLLVSVRSAAEAETAGVGGADLIDVKEPTRGSLGAVDPAMLARIAAAVPESMPLSIALGDHATPTAAARTMDLIGAVARRPTELYVKVGLAGVAGPAAVHAVLEATVEAAEGSPLKPEVVAVAYADHQLAGGVAPKVVLEAAAQAGARGVLLDTWTKDGRSLFAWAAQSDIRRWLERARTVGLLTALAGSLALDQMDLVSALDPDVLGVRGAACENGRAGAVSARLVRQLAAASRHPNQGLRVIA
jgi:uncharacterized protein (UPF0264 family)